jgi:enoyl-CoA hydratase/carnithine racemase
MTSKDRERAGQTPGMVTDVTDLRAVRYEVADRIATVTLDRPQRLNAWTGRMHTEYRWCLARAEADPAVRVVVVTGAGRGFCAGADTGALERNAEAGGYDDGVREPLATPGYGVRPEFDHAFAFHYGMATPVIAAVNGPAAGVGLVLACYCDLRFAAAGAKLTTSAPRLGLPAEYGLSWVLPRLVGLGHAADLLLSSRVVLAEEAATMGLVNKVLPPDELLPHTYAYARALATEVSPASLRETKRQIYGEQHDDVGTAVERSVALIDEMMGGADYAEGVRAWTERRAPDFPDPG